MRIKGVTEDFILFDNGDKITSYHDASCCETNYADFSQIDDLAYDYEFSTPLEFEAVNGSGFRFGNKGNMVFVPCYSEQEGYYSSELDIYHNDKCVIKSMECEERFY